MKRNISSEYRVAAMQWTFLSETRIRNKRPCKIIAHDSTKSIYGVFTLYYIKSRDKLAMLVSSSTRVTMGTVPDWHAETGKCQQANWKPRHVVGSKDACNIEESERRSLSSFYLCVVPCILKTDLIICLFGHGSSQLWAGTTKDYTCNILRGFVIAMLQPGMWEAS